ncbi:MAG: two-component system response regulator [Rhizobiales bacterium 17-65-6]|nr:MAG: two-component system response regulator [Rhizobiales bacterium 17-65-6]OZA84710.1 MAG: two-component system response regulator [Azorhizobium sp. 39-67-5]
MITIVDDDEAVRTALGSLIRSLGLRASTFASADAFLNSERVHDTSCLITDIQMPGISGIELQARLRAQGNRMPVIFITAFPEERVRRRAMAAGAVGFLSKPFDGSAIIDCIDRALGAPT